jgi:hypothetical protein
MAVLRNNSVEAHEHTHAHVRYIRTHTDAQTCNDEHTYLRASRIDAFLHFNHLGDVKIAVSYKTSITSPYCSSFNSKRQLLYLAVSCTNLPLFSGPFVGISLKQKRKDLT